MTSRRCMAIFIGFLVLAHAIVMATDLHAAHADNHDPDHQPVLALVCTEDEAIAQGARVPLEPPVLLVSALAGPVTIPDIAVLDAMVPDAPSPTGQALRAFLQVFLN